MAKKLVSILGILVGVAILIIGFSVRDTSVSSSSYYFSGGPSIGENIKFGADFYTEIYSVTKEVGEAVNTAGEAMVGSVNNAQRNISNAAEDICNAIGWLIVALGLIDICYFATNLVSCFCAKTPLPAVVPVESASATPAICALEECTSSVTNLDAEPETETLS